MTDRRLVADAGGSNVRFAVADAAGAVTRIETRRVGESASFAEALAAYVAGHRGVDIAACAVAAAGPVDGDRVKLTNNDWSIDRAEVSKALGGVPTALVNDLEAVAAALPHLAPADCAAIGGPAFKRPEHRAMLALNVGTGLGAASAVRREGRWWTCPSEAGHMTLGPLSIEGIEVAAEAASLESVLSGRGVVALYARVAGARGRHGELPGEASEVFARAGSDPVAAQTVALLTTVLGRVAGDLALATSAWGGVYFCGSVAAAWARLADAERFRAEFSRKGPMRDRMTQIPTAVIRREHVALFGLAMLPVTR